MTVKQVAATGRGAAPAQLREAERGFKLKLRRKFSAGWIADNAADLMAQANLEYGEWLLDNDPHPNPIGFLIQCAYWRAVNLLDEENRRPTSTSLDGVLHLADEATRSPEQQVLDRDRQGRLQEAIEFLPDKQQKLLALVYFYDHSVREAGRKLGLKKSMADKHHRAAMDKLRALVGDRSLLNLDLIGIAAWASVYGGRDRLAAAADTMLTPAREVLAIGLEAAEWVTKPVDDLARRLAPGAEQASAAASSGGGRLAGACLGTAVTVLCGIAAGGSGPAGVAAIDAAVPAGPSRPAPIAEPALVTPDPIAPVDTSTVTRPEPATSVPSTPTRTETTRQSEPTAKPPTATPQQTRDEFGIEAPSSSSTSSEPAPESSGSPSTSGSAGGSSSGGSTPPAQEFGL